MFNQKDIINNIVLSVEHVSKTYMLGSVDGKSFKEGIKRKFIKKESAVNHFNALNNVSFTVDKGETIGLIGSNGAGKSTLLKLISRITTPSEGVIKIKGRVSSLLEVGTGFHPELTGRENIYLNGSILGMNKEEIDKKIESIIDFSECSEFIDTPVKRYSSGMYVKLAFAVAAHLDSEILIMDEVLAVGDIRFQKKCIAKMRELASGEGRTIIYVSHNTETVRDLCNRCIVLDKGSIVFDGKTDEAIKLYNGDSIRTELSVDLSKYIRPSWLSRDDVRMTFCEYTGVSSNVFSDDKMQLKFAWTINSDIQDVGIRIEIKDEKGAAIATKVVYEFLSGKKGDKGENTIDINLYSLMNGSYKTVYTLFEVNSYSEGIDIDCVNGLEFKINNSIKDSKLKWRGDSWGYLLVD